MSGTAADCGEGACCVLYRGTVYLRPKGESHFRSVGNVSQLRIEHVEDDMTPLDGGKSQACCGISSATIQLTMRCADARNMVTGTRGTLLDDKGEVVTRAFTFAAADTEEVLLPFDRLVDAKNVTAVASPVSSVTWRVTPAGIIAKKALAGATATLTATYRTRDVAVVQAGTGCNDEYELLYHGTNAFDGSPVVVRIPRMRLSASQGLDWIHDNDAGDVQVSGAILPSSGAVRWYSIERPT